MRKNILAGSCFFLIFFTAFIEARSQTPTIVHPNSSPLPGQAGSGPSPIPTAAEGSGSPLLDEIKAVQDEIAELSDKLQDSSQLYSLTLRKNVEDLMQDKVQAAKQAGDVQKAGEILKEIDDWEALRQNDWDQRAALLEKKSRLRQLQIDRLAEINRKFSEKYQEQGDQKKVFELNEGLGFINQMKDIETQNLELNKALLLSREKYDYKSADEIREKQKALRERTNDLTKKANIKLKQMEENQSVEELNL